MVQVAIHGDDRLDRAGLARGERTQFVAGFDRAAGDQAGEAAKIEIGAIDPLHRHAERLGLTGGVADLDGLEVVDQDGTIVPGRVAGSGGDVVAGKAGHGNGREILNSDAVGEFPVIGHDRFELFLIVVDQVHLVDGQDEVLDAELVTQEAVTPGLDQHALARIDQDNRAIGGRGARHHVARILLVSRAVGDDELAFLGREKAIGDVDRDTLFALGGKPVDEQGEVDILTLRAHAFAVVLERGELVLEDHLRIVEQAADQRRFAIIHAAAGDEAQHRLVLVLLEIGLDIVRDQRVGFVDGIGHQK